MISDEKIFYFNFGERTQGGWHALFESWLRRLGPLNEHKRTNPKKPRI